MHVPHFSQKYVRYLDEEGDRVARQLLIDLHGYAAQIAPHLERLRAEWSDYSIRREG